jgi:hypothetical protein
MHNIVTVQHAEELMQCFRRGFGSSHIDGSIASVSSPAANAVGTLGNPECGWYAGTFLVCSLYFLPIALREFRQESPTIIGRPIVVAANMDR